MKRILRRDFFISLFWKQNDWHKHGVLVHTLRVVQECIKAKRYDFIPAAIFHDIGKPFVAYQDESDKLKGTYSFHNHEEISFQIIKRWPFLSDKTKSLVRYHYLLRAIMKTQEKGQVAKNVYYIKKLERQSDSFKQDLKIFQKIDDIAKD